MSADPCLCLGFCVSALLAEGCLLRFLAVSLFSFSFLHTFAVVCFPSKFLLFVPFSVLCPVALPALVVPLCVFLKRHKTCISRGQMPVVYT